MSHQYDIFDNLNSYLDKSDDCVIPDEDSIIPGEDDADIEDSMVVPAPDPMPLIRKKRLSKKSQSEESLKSSPPKKNSTRHEIVQPQSSNENAAFRSTTDIPVSSDACQLEVETICLDLQFEEMEKMYDLIFNQYSCTNTMNKRYLATLKKRYQALLRQRSAPSLRPRRSHGPSLLENLQDLKDIFYNICVNHNLMASTSMASASELNGTAEGQRRRRNRQQAVEVVNLVDSPALILPGVINLDSEEEDTLHAKNNADYSFESENYEMSIKVKWRGKIERFTHRKYQKFGDLIAQLSKRVNADPSCVILDINERIIDPNDTPDSIDYRISQFITGRAVERTVADMLTEKNTNTNKRSKAVANINSITLKVQSDRWKQPLQVLVEKTQKMAVVAIKAAEELKCKPAEIKLSFDGEPIELDSTPLDLELEGGEVLDLRISK
ncbi:uncharacterized protein LOC131676546 [Topomyia yanbarensis]|uniref:uncharacterized protein LOC131676546 n=1 Tax=Topomyia yanbarensis TaxID=2498891 RepID=UPI00273C9F46|nr:uncharacterized protein LOC131676546 [Topomyia yanbarensis]